MTARIGKAVRKTTEVDVEVELHLDKPGYKISLSADKQEEGLDLGILEHMLAQILRLGEIGGKIVGHGDHVHHIAEDAAIAIGQALKQALGERMGIQRAASHIMPMEGTLVTVAIDISGRGYAIIDFRDMDNPTMAGMAQHILTAIAQHAGVDIYVKAETIGPFAIRSDHHKLETVGKAFGIVLHFATRITRTGIPSTKGTLGA